MQIAGISTYRHVGKGKKRKKEREKKRRERGKREKNPDEGFVRHVHLQIDLCNSKVIRIDGEEQKWGYEKNN